MTHVNPKSVRTPKEWAAYKERERHEDLADARAHANPRVPHRMVGTVTAREGYYSVIECPDAAAHLRVLHLTPRQVMGAKVGDRVLLEYHVSPSSGLWNVIEIVEKGLV